jgi:outer membrane protein assembly factor BamB
MLYVSNPSDSKTGRFKHGMVALKAGSDCKLSLAWQRTVGSTQTSLSAPTVANGVVYYGDGQNDTEFAFNAATGHQLWHKKLKGSLYAAPTVINGKLLVPAWDNKLYAFGL